MAEAQEQVRAMLEEARREAQAVGRRDRQEGTGRGRGRRQRAERDIATARDQALVEIWSKTADLAVSVAGRVLARDLGPDDHRRLIETAVAELPRPGRGNGHAQGGAPA